MKKLKNLIKLGCKVSVYVPATIDIDCQVDNSKYVEETGKILSECFGGATSTKCVGMWVSDSKGLIKENTTLVFAYCTSEQLESSIDTVIDYCINLKNKLRQDAVALEVNGEMYFI